MTIVDAASKRLAGLRPPHIDQYDGDVQKWARDVSSFLARQAEAIEIQSEIADSGKESQYTITNDQTDRTFDADAVTTAELADIVATVIKDLGL